MGVWKAGETCLRKGHHADKFGPEMLPLQAWHWECFVQKCVACLSPASLFSLSMTQVCGTVEVKKVMYITAEKLTYRFCHSPYTLDSKGLTPPC